MSSNTGRSGRPLRVRGRSRLELLHLLGKVPLQLAQLRCAGGSAEPHEPVGREERATAARELLRRGRRRRGPGGGSLRVSAALSPPSRAALAVRSWPADGRAHTRASADTSATTARMPPARIGPSLTGPTEDDSSFASRRPRSRGRCECVHHALELYIEPGPDFTFVCAHREGLVAGRGSRVIPSMRSRPLLRARFSSSRGPTFASHRRSRCASTACATTDLCTSGSATSGIPSPLTDEQLRQSSAHRHSTARLTEFCRGAFERFR